MTTEMERETDMELDLTEDVELARLLGVSVDPNPDELPDALDYPLEEHVEEVPTETEHPTVPLTNIDSIHQTPAEIASGWSVPDIETDQDCMEFDFVQPTSPLRMRNEGRNPMDFLEAFFDKEMWLHIVDETNRYAGERLRQDGDDHAERSQHPHFKPRARLNDWKPITLGELKVFVAHLIIMGLVRKPDIEMYWSGSSFTRTPFFGVYMSRDRFQNILANLHVNDDTNNPPYPEPGHDALAKVRNFVTMMQENFSHVYKPKRDISIDEGSMPWKGRLRFRQYNPSKPARFHVKLFQVCEATSSYIVGFNIFTGTGSCHKDEASSDPEATVTTKTVLTLLKDCDLCFKGHSIYMDNYYNSPALLEELLERDTLGCGTVRSNRKGLPESLVKANLKESGQCCYRRKKLDVLGEGGMMCVKWVDKRPVTMLSTIHAATNMWTGKHKRNEERTPIYKPTVIVQYTSLMGGVDLSDQLMNYYNFLRRTKKWWRKMWVHLLNMILHNAYILNRNFGHDKKMSHYDFREEIALQLIAESRPARVVPAAADYIPPELLPGHLDGKHFLEKLEKEEGQRCILPKSCKVCKISKTDQKKGKGTAFAKFTTFRCEQCKIAMCANPCFKVYHTEKDYKAALDNLS
jgi:hypothetical protein